MASNKNPPARARGWAWAACALLGAAAALASAATLQISPVSIDLAANQPGAAFTLRNPGATPLYGQLRVFQWDQENGEDILTPTQNLAASPPILEVAPGSEQLVRIVRTGMEGDAKESAYRILIGAARRIRRRDPRRPRRHRVRRRPAGREPPARRGGRRSLHGEIRLRPG